MQHEKTPPSLNGRTVWVVVDDHTLEVFASRQAAIDYIQPWWDEFGEDSLAAPDYYEKTIGEPFEPSKKVVGT